MQTGTRISENYLAAVARLRVRITDVNNKVPEFQGVDINGHYPAAVSDYTRRNDQVIFVSAIDLDTTSPNNVVSTVQCFVPVKHVSREICISANQFTFAICNVLVSSLL